MMAASLGYAAALRDASSRDARCSSRRSSKLSARVRWQQTALGRLAQRGLSCWRAAGRRPGSTPTRRSPWLGTQKERGERGVRPAPARRVHAHADPPEVEQAEAHYRQALALADELGMRPLQAHCHRGLGTLYATTGQREQARTALSTAIEMYRDMEMTFWLPETEAALAQVDA